MGKSFGTKLGRYHYRKIYENYCSTFFKIYYLCPWTCVRVRACAGVCTCACAQRSEETQVSSIASRFTLRQELLELGAQASARLEACKPHPSFCLYRPFGAEVTDALWGHLGCVGSGFLPLAFMIVKQVLLTTEPSLRPLSILFFFLMIVCPWLNKNCIIT